MPTEDMAFLQKTLKLAQQLYENRKLITYPRTDSRYLSQDLVPVLRPLVQNLEEGLRHICKTGSRAFQTSRNKGLVDDSKVTDHHAIILPKQK